jgi:hypothetical protein
LYDTVPKYVTVILTGDFNTKSEKKFVLVSVRYTLHDVKSGNGQKLIYLAQMHDMIAVSTNFEDKSQIKDMDNAW